jgi:hypothetical protein
MLYHGLYDLYGLSASLSPPLAEPYHAHGDQHHHPLLDYMISMDYLYHCLLLQQIYIVLMVTGTPILLLFI